MTNIEAVALRSNGAHMAPAEDSIYCAGGLAHRWRALGVRRAHHGPKSADSHRCGRR
jgi:hypothetical protein